MSFVIKFKGFLRRQRQHGMPPFSRCNQRSIAAGVKIYGEIAGSPKRAAGFISAIGLLLIKYFAARAAVVSECSLVSPHHHSKTRHRIARSDFVLIAADGEPVGFVGFIVYR